MARTNSTQFKGLIPLVDRRRIPEPFVLEGRNFYVDADGPISGFAKTVVFGQKSIDTPDNVQSFRINSGTKVVLFAPSVVLEFSVAAQGFIPIFSFVEPTSAFPWTAAVCGGKNYFAKKGVGLVEYDPATEIWELLSGGIFPSNIQACTQSGGRLILAAEGISAWSAIDDGRDFAPSTATGAGAQVLSIVAAVDPDDIISVIEVADGYLTITRNGIMRSELVDRVNPFRHRRMTKKEDPLPLSAFCLVEISDSQHIMLAKQGFYSITSKGLEVYQPIMGEYFHSQILPIFNLDVTPNVIRLAANTERQWLVVSIANNQAASQYTQAFILYIPSDQWGKFNQLHTGFIDLDIKSSTRPGVTYGYVSPDGAIYLFTDSALDYLSPALGRSIYHYEVNLEYPARVNENGVHLMPSRLHFSPIDESVFNNISGVYDLEFVFEERIEPLDGAAIELDSILAIPNEMKDVLQMADGIRYIIISPAAQIEAGLDSEVEVGLFRFGTENTDPDETSLITDVILGMAESGVTSATEEEDYMLDYPIDVEFDWLLETGDEDWGEGIALGVGTGYQADIVGTHDGYTTFGVELDPPYPMDEALSLVKQEGRSRLYSCNNNALYHYVRISALETNESYHLKVAELRGILTGRI